MPGANGVRLIGRANVLARVEAHGRCALAGDPRLLLVTGDPGIGKTEFLRRSGDLLRLLGLHVPQASGEESESDVPFAMLSELMATDAPVPPSPPAPRASPSPSVPPSYRFSVAYKTEADSPC
jgi:hypothetical protein